VGENSISDLQVLRSHLLGAGRRAAPTLEASLALPGSHRALRLLVPDPCVEIGVRISGQFGWCSDVTLSPAKTNREPAGLVAL